MRHSCWAPKTPCLFQPLTILSLLNSLINHIGWGWGGPPKETRRFQLSLLSRFLPRVWLKNFRAHWCEAWTDLPCSSLAEKIERTSGWVIGGALSDEEHQTSSFQKKDSGFCGSPESRRSLSQPGFSFSVILTAWGAVCPPWDACLCLGRVILSCGGLKPRLLLGFMVIAGLKTSRVQWLCYKNGNGCPCKLSNLLYYFLVLFLRYWGLNQVCFTEMRSKPFLISLLLFYFATTSYLGQVAQAAFELAVFLSQFPRVLEIQFCATTLCLDTHILMSWGHDSA